MKINVIDLSFSLLKVSQFETTPDNLLELTACVMRNVLNFEMETIKLEIYRIMKESELKDADKNIFILGNNASCSVEEVLNSLKHSVYKKKIKDLTKLAPREHTVKEAFIQNQSYSANMLYTILYVFTEETKNMIKELSSTLHLKSVTVTDHSHLRFLDYPKYSLIDFGYSAIRVYNVENEVIQSIDASNKGIQRILDLQKTSTSFDESFEWNMATIQSKQGASEQCATVTNSLSNLIKHQLVITTGGGTNSKFIKETKGITVIPLETLLQPLFVEPVNEVLLRYLGTSVLAVDAVVNGKNIASLVQDYSSLDILERNSTVIYATTAISVLLFILTFNAVNINRNLSIGDGYLSSPLDVTLRFGQLIVPNPMPIEHEPSAEAAIDPAELSSLISELGTKVENLQSTATTSSKGSTVLQIREYVTIYSKSELYGVERTAPGRLTYLFRGNVGDVKAVEDILKLYYSSVRYSSVRIDDLDSFSVMIYKFEVVE